MKISHYILILIATLGALTAPHAYGIPQAVGSPPQATLRDDGSIIIKPGEQIILKFEHRDGRIIGLTKLPWDTKDMKDIIRIGLRRDGGTATKLGPISPITDTLLIGNTMEKPLSARCEYTTLSSPKPERSRLSGKNGKPLEKSFRWGVSQIKISEIQFKIPGEQ